MPALESLKDFRKCECFSDLRTRKVRWTVGDAQRFLDKLHEKDFNMMSGGSEAAETTKVRSEKILVVKNSEVLELESGDKLYGKEVSQIGPGMGHWVWNKNFFTLTQILSPKNEEDMAKASKVDKGYFRGLIDKKPDYFEPFDLTVKDCSHMEAGPQMTCNVCSHPLSDHMFNTLKREKQWVWSLGTEVRAQKQARLEELQRGATEAETNREAATRAKQQAEAAKIAAMQALHQKLANFNSLATTTSYDKFLRQQIDVLGVQKSQIIEAPDSQIPSETKEVMKASIEEYMAVLEETRKTLLLVKATEAIATAVDVDESAMQASMDRQQPADGVPVDSSVGNGNI